MKSDRCSEVKRLYDAALGRSAGERAAFLDAACAGDASLRREVESLLAREPAADRFMESPAMAGAARGLAADDGPSLAGRTVSHYRILGKLGAGGMGVVYRALDLELGRAVAIKVLPTHSLTDPERRARFVQEARNASALNHPNIVTIHEVARADDTDFIVMEYVAGQTLDQRIGRKGLDRREALKCAVQIADALAAAHRAGIVHRDVKPRNIIMADDGRVKLLDFGLAKLTEPDPGGDTKSLTHEGAIVGTLAYMSPEQVQGKQVDRRSDIFSFGAVLYEMLTGRRVFERDSRTATVNAILEADPPGVENAPAELARLIARCLRKDPARRAQDMDDVRVALEDVAAEPERPPGARRTAKPAFSILALVLVCLAGGAAASLIVWRMKPSSPAGPVSRLVIPLPPGEQVAAWGDGAVAISPDGSRLAYVAGREGSQRIYVRAIDQLESAPIAGTEGGAEPFFSPDGQSLGFFAHGKLKRVFLAGGAPVDVCEAPDIRGACWGPGDLIAIGFGRSGLGVVSAGGGSPRALTTPDASNGEVAHRWPEFLPDGRAVLFTVWKGGADSEIAVYSLDKGERRTLVKDGSQTRYAPSGHIVFARADSLLAMSFDAARLEVTGAPAPVAEGVLRTGNDGALFGVSHRGSLAYVPGGYPKRALAWVDRRGAARPLPAPPHNYGSPRLSHDGRRVVVGVFEVGWDIWAYDLVRGTLTRLTHDGRNHHPIWAPDGERVTFESFRAGVSTLVWKPSDGSGVEETLTAEEHAHSPQSWSPDGRVLLFDKIGTATGSDLWALALDRERKSRPFVATPFYEAGARFSPDGRWVAYVSDESGRQEVYVRPYPGPGSRSAVSTGGGTEVVWAPSGRELFYRSGDRMIAVPITTGSTFTAGKPTLLFEVPYAKNPSEARYDVTSDGEQFLMVTGSGPDSAPTQIVLIQEWIEAMKHRANR